MQRIAALVCAVIIIALANSQLKAQNMTTGFAMLEAGEFIEAKAFFKTILAKDSLNQTALICYGRATGLSGDVAEAQQIFHQLLAIKPGSEEVLLNLAESHLWDGKGEPAAAIYADILSANPTNFVALLGYANSKSLLKEYAVALQYINSALKVHPDNAQAKVSRKYIRLGLADYLAAQLGQYDEALALVNANLEDNAQDQNSLMLKATIYLLSEEYKLAQNVYAERIENTLDRYIGKSTTAHLLNDDKRALNIAEEGIIKLEKDTVNLLRMQMHYVSALLWNDQLKTADKFLSKLIKAHPDQNDLLATKAQVHIYLSDYEGGLDHYQRFLENNPDSFSGNLGSADANHALGMDNRAYEGAFRTLNYFPGQKDALSFLNRLNTDHAPMIETGLVISETSDQSYRQKWYLNTTASITPLLQVSSGYSVEKFGDTTQDHIQVESIYLGSAYRINRRIKLSTQLETAKATGTTFNTNYINHTLQADIRMSKSQQLVLAQQNELQNFNKTLLTQNIKMSHIIVKNISFWKLPKIGWYTEIYHTNLSDGNTRNLLFTSIYKNLTRKPLIKVGVNFSAMSFEQSKPTEYYSPRSFQNYELFAGININQSKSFPVSILADVAAGYQLSDADDIMAWRASIKIEYVSNRFKIKAFAQHNSLSAVTNNGFSFSQAGCSVSYALSKKPIFYSKYNK